MTSTLIVTGSRSWTDAEFITRVLRDARDRAGVQLVVHGDARGVDRMADRAAEALGLNRFPMAADWSEGPGAGYARNLRMLDRYPAAYVCGFWDGESRGTSHMLYHAATRGRQVIAYQHLGHDIIRRRGRDLVHELRRARPDLFQEARP